MLPVVFLSVNAFACTPVPRRAPERDSRPWPAHLRVPTLAPSATETLSADPVRVWTTSAGRGFSGPPAIGDSVIVVQTTDQKLVALDRETGRKIWTARVDGLGATGPLLGTETVFTATAKGQVSAVALRTGRAQWRRSIEPGAGPLVLTDDRLYAATTGGRLYGLDRASGAVEWRSDLEAPLRAGPALHAGYLVVATDDSLFCLDARDGTRTVTVAARGLSLQPPAVSGGLFVYASPDGFLAAYRAGTLERAWQVELHRPFMSSPAVARDTVYAVTLDGALERVALAGPREPTTSELHVAVRATPAPIASGVLIATVGGEILWLDAGADTPRWKTRVDGPLEHPPIVDRGMLIFVDGRGRIHAWR